MRPWFFHVFVVLLGLALPACSQQSQLASQIMTQSGYAPDAGVLSVHVSGFGSVISTDQGQTVFCQATCDTFLGTGASVVLKATPQPGYHFAGWSGACSGIGNCNVTLAAAQTVSATFAVGRPRPQTSVLCQPRHAALPTREIQQGHLAGHSWARKPSGDSLFRAALATYPPRPRLIH
jgi:hypothetical protein